MDIYVNKEKSQGKYFPVIAGLLYKERVNYIRDITYYDHFKLDMMWMVLVLVGFENVALIFAVQSVSMDAMNDCILCN